MPIIIGTIWITVLRLLSMGIFTFSDEKSSKYSLKKYNTLRVALIIQTICSLILIAIFISAIFISAIFNAAAWSVGSILY